MSLYVGGLIAYLSGMGLYLVLGTGFSLIFSLCFIMLTLAGVFLKRYSSVKAVYAVLFALGALLLSVSSEPKATVFDRYLDRYVEIHGVICEMPDEYEKYNSYILETSEIVYLNNTEKVSGKIRLTSDIKLDMGNRVAVRGFVDTIAPPDNSTEFDYRMHYRAKGITFKMHAQEAEIIKERAFLWSVPYMAEYAKSRVAMAIDRFYTNDDSAMLKAVLLGNRSNFSDGFNDILKRTSAIRFLYPSYLHIFLLVALCEVLFVFTKPKNREKWIIASMFVFVLANSGFITFARAGILYMFDWLYRRKRGFAHYPDMASAVILIMLIAKPLLLYNSGFVMSVTIGILLHHFRYPLAGCFKFINNSRIRVMIAIWLIATVGLIPLSAYYYNGAPIYSIIFTFVYTPFVIILLITAPIALLMYELFGTASVVGMTVDGILEIMKNLPTIVSLLPGHYITLARTSLTGFLIWGISCYGIKLAVDERCKEPIFKGTIASLIFLFAIVGISKLSDFGKLNVTFVNVGQGDASIVEIKGKSVVLIDGGGGTGDEEYNIGEEVYLPYLVAKGYGRIDLAIVSHSHRDHAEGIISAIEALDVHTLMISDTSEDNNYRDKLIETAEENGTEVLYVSAGDRIEFDSELSFDVVYPSKNTQVNDENDYSLALIGEYKGTKMFFGGDITDNAEEKIAGKIGEMDIVKISHHGSKGSSSKEFIKETSPVYAVASAGRNNLYGHPSDRVIDDYTEEGAKILRTDLMNDIIITADSKGNMAAGWYGEVQRCR